MRKEYGRLMSNRSFLKKGSESIEEIKRIGKKLDDIIGRKKYVDENLGVMKRKKKSERLKVLKEI